jgi:hypothetical protein
VKTGISGVVVSYVGVRLNFDENGVTRHVRMVKKVGWGVQGLYTNDVDGTVPAEGAESPSLWLAVIRASVNCQVPRNSAPVPVDSVPSNRNAPLEIATLMRHQNRNCHPRLCPICHKQRRSA